MVESTPSNSNGFPVPTSIVVFDTNGNSVSLPADEGDSTGSVDPDAELPGVDVEDFSDEVEEAADEIIDELDPDGP